MTPHNLARAKVRPVDPLARLVLAMVPDWMPEELVAVCRSFEGLVEFKLAPGEKKVFRKPRRILPSEWAERHRVVHESSMAGLWRNDSVPYAAGILDASFFPTVGTVIVQKCVQSGGSEAVHTCIGYAIDRDPGPCMYVYPDQLTAKDNSRDRIKPMLEHSRRLSEYFTGVEDDKSSLRIKLEHMSIHLAWAGSVARLANKPVRYLVLDELNKYPDKATSEETNPEALAEKRTTTYEGSEKIWKISTPTVPTGAITVAMENEAERVFQYYVRCPDCGFAHLPSFDRIRWPDEERDPRRVLSKKLAWYECPHCGSCWGDFEKNRAVQLGEWLDRDSGLQLMASLKAERPRAIGFHIPAWISPFVSLGKSASAWLKAQKDVSPVKWKTNLKDFVNQFEGDPWEIHEQQRAEDVILALKDARPFGAVPGPVKGARQVAALTAGIDTQDNGWWYEIRAWGWGSRQESWQIRAGFVLTLEDLASILWDEPYTDPEGNVYPVRLSVIDSGGHQTGAVYKWCRLHRRRTFALKGGAASMPELVKFSKIEHYPKIGKKAQEEIPGGIRLLHANVSAFKDDLSTLLSVAPGDPGGWHMAADMTDSWAGHMCAEYVDDAGRWVCPKGKANHGWDCSVYNLVAAHILRIPFWNPKKALLDQPKKAKRKKQSVNPWTARRR